MRGKSSFDGVAVTTKTKAKGPLHLHFSAGQVLITPRDHDRFVMAARGAVETLQKQAAIAEWLEKFEDEYLPLLFGWCEEHKHQITSCYLGAPSPHGLTVFVVGASGGYNFELGEAISHLGLQLEQEGWSSNILQIVAEEDEDLLTYFDPEISLQVYAQATTTPGQG
jgi:hypothetical protein